MVNFSFANLGGDTVSYGSNVTAGNLLVFVYWGQGISGHPITGYSDISDTRGNTYSLAVISTPLSTGQCLAIWYCVTKTSGPNTITLTPSGQPPESEIVIYEFSGFPYGVYIDGTPVSACANFTAPESIGPLTTHSSAGDVVLGPIWFQGTSAGPGSGWTGAVTTDSNLEQYQLTTGPGTYTSTSSPSDVWSGSVVAFAPLAPPTGLVAVATGGW
jgi:hypothetical protein